MCNACIIDPLAATAQGLAAMTASAHKHTAVMSQSESIIQSAGEGVIAAERPAAVVVSEPSVAPAPAKPADNYDRFRATKKFGSLDGLRALSILAVIWSHAGNGTADGPLGALPVRGPFGVDLFFVISGFLITTLLLREKDTVGRVSLKDFYIRRSLRIFPLYYAVLGVNALWVWLAARGTWQDQQFWDNLPYFLTYTYNWVDPFCTDHWIFSLSWSLATEEQFYLVWPVLFVFTPRAVQLAALATAIGLDVAYSFPSQIAPLAEQPFYERFFAGLSTPICLGVLMALTLHSKRGFETLRRVLGHRLAAPLLLAVLLVVLAFPDLPGGQRTSWSLAWLAACALIGACVVREDNGLAKVLRWKPIVWMGIVSYGLYLLHPLANSAAMRLLPRVGLTEGFGVERFVSTIAMTCVAAALSFYLFEKWFIRLKDRFTPPRDPAQVQAARSAAMLAALAKAKATLPGARV